MQRWKSRILRRNKYYERYGNLYESQSLSRVWKHSQKGFFMMSSFRGIYSQEENLERHQGLKRQLKRVNLGFFEVDGQYKYDDGTIETELSVFEDIIFEADVFDLHIQFKGGLRGDEIIGLYRNRKEAIKITNELLGL